MASFSPSQTRPGNITAGCFDNICDPWEPPPDCCNVCEEEGDQELFDMWWCAISEWAFQETCCQFPGHCPVETEPCPPCGCVCSDYCGCGPWASLSLSGAFCHPICVTDGVPCLEFVYPAEDPADPPTILGPDSGYWQLRPDLLTVDWCKPFSNSCGSMWQDQNHCDRPWTVRAMVGKEPPKLLLHGVAAFVCEIVKDCKGLDNCLPDGVRSVTRRGITADIGPQFEETVRFDTQGTGITSLDFALRKWGCDQLPVRAYADPMQSLRHEKRQVWTWRGKLNPTPPSCAPEPEAP